MEIPCELQIEPSGDVNIKADKWSNAEFLHCRQLECMYFLVLYDSQDVSDCTRRAKKRSGYVSFANIYAEEKFAPSESFTLDATNTGLRCNVVEREDAEFIHEIPVKYKKDRNLEVAVYSFPVSLTFTFIIRIE
ncbi:unnamed protein product [Trichobilharzia regenti]|nr:unnamed protein product [Trichobilharzia regenti]